MTHELYYPFPPRPGTRLDSLPDNIETVALTEGQREAVVTFEHGLYDTELDSTVFPKAATFAEHLAENGTPLSPLEAIWKKKSNPTTLGVGYFMTEAGRELLADTVALSETYQTPEECARVLNAVDIKNIDSKALGQLEAKSVGYEEKTLTQQFIEADFDGQDLPAPQFVKLYKHPEVLFEKAQGYRHLKGYLKQVKSDLLAADPNGEQPETRAKLLITDLYRGKVNQLLAATYVSAYQFLASTQDPGAAVDTFKPYLPAFADRAENPKTANFLQALDRYNRGVSEDEQGELTWLSPDAHAMAASSETNEPSQPVDREGYADFSQEDLDTILVDGETFGDWMSTILAEYDLLSENTDWDSERVGPASDGKWQVIVNDRFKSLSVSDRQRIVMVPTMSRSISNAVALSSHEQMHVLQNENKRKIGQLAILEKIGINAASEQTEAGGKWQERVAQETMTGQTDTTVAGIGYYKMLKVKERGGSYGECVQAYYEDLRAQKPDIAPEKAAAQAVNRARRIFRNGGFEYAQESNHLTNTQPLTYLEQQLIYKQLDGERRKLLYVGGATARTLGALAAVGLVDTRQIFVPKRLPAEILQPKVAELIAASDSHA